MYTKVKQVSESGTKRYVVKSLKPKYQSIARTH